MSSEGTGSGAFNSSGSESGVSIYNPQDTFAAFSGTPTLTAMPTKIAIDTTSGYVIDSANYHDVLILNGGFRYDNYNIKTSGFGTVNGVAGTFGQQAGDFLMPNFNLGITWKPIPITSIYIAYATSSDPVGAEFDGTSANYGGLAPVVNGGSNQIFGPQQNRAIEVGNKWELFDRHLLVSGALFQTTVTNARESVNITSTANQTAACPYNVAIAGTQPCISAGAAYEIHGVDLEVAGKITDKWSVFGGLVLMKSAVTKSLVPPADPALYSTNVGLPLANIANQSFSMLTKYQLNDMLGDRWTGRLSLQDLWRHSARRQPGHVAPELLDLQCVRGGQDQQELAGEAVRQQHLQQALLHGIVSEQRAVRSGSAGPRRIRRALGEVLTTTRCWSAFPRY